MVIWSQEPLQEQTISMQTDACHLASIIKVIESGFRVVAYWKMLPIGQSEGCRGSRRSIDSTTTRISFWTYFFNFGRSQSGSHSIDCSAFLSLYFWHRLFPFLFGYFEEIFHLNYDCHAYGIPDKEQYLIGD